MLVPVVALGAMTGCKDVIEAEISYDLNDADRYPEQEGPYAEEVAGVISSWQSGALTDEDAAAQLFAYACYSEEYLDSYVYFSNQGGSTDYGGLGTSAALKQDYKLIVNGDDEEEGGFKFHYTIKHVTESSGLLSAAKSLFESAKMRIVTEDSLLYRLDGKDVKYDKSNTMLSCDWVVDSSDWGNKDPAIVKRSGDKLDLDGIKKDIVSVAQSDPGNAVIHGNINILADDIVESATISENTLDGNTVYDVSMTINTDAANKDDYSIAMLESSNSASSCSWTSYVITFRIWDNGLFRQYMLIEFWSGTVFGFSGSAGSLTYVQYSYSANDTDPTDKKAFLEAAKATV